MPVSKVVASSFIPTLNENFFTKASFMVTEKLEYDWKS